MKYIALAKNIKTGEVVELERYNTVESAWWDIGHNLEWDEDDVREDWFFEDISLLTGIPNMSNANLNKAE